MILRVSLLTLALVAAAIAAEPYPVLRVPHIFPGSRLFVPNSDAPRTSIVMLHGSEGGSIPYFESEATILASQGFAVLTLCYFDCNRGLVGPRQTLKDVDAGLVLRAVAWLREQPSANGKVVVYGFSRGAELTLVTGSLVDVEESQRPNALIAHSPSDLYNSYYNWSWREPSCWLCRRGINQCPDASRRSDFQWNPSCGPDDETRMDFSNSAWIIGGQRIRSGTRIAIERYPGPILITVGEKDTLWPHEQTRRVEATLRAADREPEVHYFPEANHIFQGDDENRRRGLVLDFLKRVP